MLGEYDSVYAVAQAELIEDVPSGLDGRLAYVEAGGDPAVREAAWLTQSLNDRVRRTELALGRGDDPSKQAQLGHLKAEAGPVLVRTTLTGSVSATGKVHRRGTVVGFPKVAGLFCARLSSA